MLHDEEITLERLIEGRSTGLCYSLIAGLDAIDLSMMFKDLCIERLNRKAREIEMRYEQGGCNWSQTAYSFIMYYLLGKANRTASQRLTSIVPHTLLMRENSALHKIEALLLGGAGLLDIFSDSFAEPIKTEFQHLAAKYSITPLSADEWQLSGIHLNNHPALRLAQIAACIHNNTISISSIAGCKSDKDVHKMFSCAASDYWVDALSRHNHDRSISSKVGSVMSKIIAINAIAPLLYTYSNYVESYTINEKALDILYDSSAEDNTYIRKWHTFKPIATDAFSSQALIQLSTEYCKRGRCHECPLSRQLLHPRKPRP